MVVGSRLLRSVVMIISFASDSFFFSSYSIDLSSLFVESCKRSKDGRKKDEDTFLLKLYFKV